MDIEHDEVGAAAEVDGPADGCSDQAPCRLSRAKPNAAPFSPRPAMDDRDELRGRVPAETRLRGCEPPDRVLLIGQCDFI